MPLSIIEYLERGPSTSKEIQAATGLSQTTIARKIRKMEDQVIAIPEGRTVKYAATCNAFNSGNTIPLSIIDEVGKPHLIAHIRPLIHGGYFVEPVKKLPSLLLGESRIGLYEDLPYFLYDLRPQGFLGHQVAKRIASRCDDFPSDPRNWNSNHIGRYLISNGDDLPGNFIFGDRGLIGVGPQFLPATEADYPDLAQKAIQGEIAGSSAGGEQSKFKRKGGSRKIMAFYMKNLTIQFVFRFFVILFAGFTVFSAVPSAFSEPDQNSTSQLIDELGTILENSLKSELSDLEKYKNRITSEEQHQRSLTAAYNGYRVQLSSFRNLLLSEDVDIAQLQKSRTELKTAMIEAQKIFQELIPGEDALKQELEHLENQKQLVDKQQAELASVKENTASGGKSLAIKKTATRLARVLKKKEELLSRLDQIYKERLDKLAEIKEAYTTLDAQFEKTIEQKKAKGLFERTKKEARFGALNSLRQDSKALIERICLVFDPQFWVLGIQKLWQNAELLAVSFFFVLAAVLVVLRRLRKEASGLTNLPVVQKLGVWHQMASDLLIMSIIPAGTALTIFLYSRLDRMVLVSGIFGEAALVIMILLGCKWIGRALKTVFTDVVGGEANARNLIRFTRSAVVFILVHGLVHAVLGQSSDLLILLRMTSAFIMLAWTLKTWRDINFNTLQSPGENHQDRNRLIRLLTTKYAMLLISGVSLMLDMTGYELLAFHWVLSWVQSLVVFFWWAILFHLLREWDHYYREQSHTRKEAFVYDDYPVQWLAIRAGQLCWMVTLSIVLLLTWGDPSTVLGHLYQVLALPLSIGNMQFSFLGAISAGFVLIFTYALVRIWKWLFQKKFLSRSGMDHGLQESITTISVYMIWALGLLIALHAFGLNTASLAVAFGALGIGIGFGLQNIFNNFISGIILLFERPIQVGDDVEINGVWANVKKINVRSTIVQTYDNASLIIPNADLISSQVTNWSFKDKRIRRKISVGVAYGSDVELVRTILLQIAADAPNVLGYPRPDVLFTDFGDSALNFVLRLWTDIDHMLAVDTDIRFRIDKKFRENNIEISFPQHDIHIRSIEGADRFFGPKE